MEWSETGFIFGAGYKKENSKKWQLLNFVAGQAKLSIYKSRKNKIENVSGKGLIPMFKTLVEARVRVDWVLFTHIMLMFLWLNGASWILSVLLLRSSSFLTM